MKLQATNPIAARYETGQRLRQFEQLWERATPEQKRQVLPLINQAVMGFFAGGPSASAKPLDQAILLLGDEKARTSERRWGMIFAVKPAAYLRDAETGTLSLDIYDLYPSPTHIENAGLDLTFTEVTISGSPKNLLSGATPRTQEWHHQPVEVTLQQTEVDGLLELRFVLRGGGQKERFVADRQVSIALAKNLKPRLAALEKSEEPSVAHLMGILTKLAAGEPLETDFPGLKLLRDAEAAAKNAPLWGKKRPGQFWLTLAKAPVRLLAPKAVATGKPLPLVIALHGAGGSENMFFDTYGAGKLVRLCEEHGCLLLTLRNGAGLGQLPELLAELGKLYPCDPKRIYLVGHSMGAAMAVQATQANPKTFAAVAVLGGGGAVHSSPDTLPPFLVGAGAADFGKPMAQSLAKNLKTECKLYPNCEHLTVVQDALGDVMVFFASK